MPSHSAIGISPKLIVIGQQFSGAINTSSSIVLHDTSSLKVKAKSTGIPSDGKFVNVASSESPEKANTCPFIETVPMSGPLSTLNLIV